VARTHTPSFKLLLHGLIASSLSILNILVQFVHDGKRNPLSQTAEVSFCGRMIDILGPVSNLKFKEMVGIPLIWYKQLPILSSFLQTLPTQLEHGELEYRRVKTAETSR